MDRTEAGTREGARQVTGIRHLAQVFHAIWTDEIDTMWLNDNILMAL